LRTGRLSRQVGGGASPPRPPRSNPTLYIAVVAQATPFHGNRTIWLVGTTGAPCPNIENRCFSRQRILAYWRQNTSPPRCDRTRRFKRSLVWRRGWDLNPRCRCQHTCSPGTPNRPLSHLSAPTFSKEVAS